MFDADNAIKIHRETIMYASEIAEGRHLIHIYMKDLLITHNWAVTRRVIETDTDNTIKNYMVPFPGFDIDSLPYVVVSGMKTMKLVNMASGEIETLIPDPQISF